MTGRCVPTRVHWAILAAVLLSGCRETSVDRPPASSRPTSPPAAPAVAAPDPWVVTEKGAGDARIGMTLDQIRAALGGDVLAPEASAPCYYVRGGSSPASLLFMMVDGRLARVDVTRESVSTAEGVRVGDTAERIRSLYAGRVVERPHKYTQGVYLIVSPDPSSRLIFEMDEAGRVTRYRAGAMPAVEWVEGCS